MLNVDISNIWCAVALPNLLESEQEVAGAHAALTDRRNTPFLPWLDGDPASLPELERVGRAAERIRAAGQALVVVGGGDEVLGVRAALELLRGERHNLRDPLAVFFTGGSFSTAAWQELTELLETRDFCVAVLSRGGSSPQEAVALRSLRWMLERRYGTEKARERVFIVTDPAEGALRALSVAEGYEAFNLPASAGGRASALTPALLLPLAAAGLDVRALLAGAAGAKTALNVRSFENPAWLYAAGRNILARKGRRAEYLCLAEPSAASFGRWWQRQFAGRECADGLGLLPVTAEIPADLPELHALLADGQQSLLATVLRFAGPAQKIPVEMDWRDIDGYNFLEGFTLDYLDEQASQAFVQTGNDGGVPLITLDCGPIGEAAAGELLYFFELSACLSAGMTGRDPWDPAPRDAWAEQTLRLLGRPGAQ